MRIIYVWDENRQTMIIDNQISKLVGVFPWRKFILTSAFNICKNFSWRFTWSSFELCEKPMKNFNFYEHVACTCTCEDSPDFLVLLLKPSFKNHSKYLRYSAFIIQSPSDWCFVSFFVSLSTFHYISLTTLTLAALPVSSC